jgi:hypothetical protein
MATAGHHAEMRLALLYPEPAKLKRKGAGIGSSEAKAAPTPAASMLCSKACRVERRREMFFTAVTHHRYNWHRPHGSLKANTPISRLGLSRGQPVEAPQLARAYAHKSRLFGNR